MKFTLKKISGRKKFNVEKTGARKIFQKISFYFYSVDENLLTLDSYHLLFLAVIHFTCRKKNRLLNNFLEILKVK